MKKDPLQRAVDQCGLSSLARSLTVSHAAVSKWLLDGRLPRTEFTGETSYAAGIERATGGKVTEKDLIDWSRKGWNTRAA